MCVCVCVCVCFIETTELKHERLTEQVMIKEYLFGQQFIFTALSHGSRNKTGDHLRLRKRPSTSLKQAGI